MNRRKQSGRFVVTGPELERERYADTVGMALSFAQGIACRSRTIGKWLVHEYDDALYVVDRDHNGNVTTREAA